MPRYFFHIFNGSAHPDAEGIELSGLEEAREEAVQTAGEIIQGEGIKSLKDSDWRMEVTDAAGHALFRLRFSLEELSGEVTSPERALGMRARRPNPAS
jgi:hypothetical protein